MVAKKVRDSLPLKLSSYWDLNFSSDDLEESSVSTVGSTTSDETFSSCLDEESGSKDSGEKIEYPDYCATLKESFLKSFRAVDKELRVHSTIDCYGSGTTAVTLVKQGQDLVIGNVGNSRAIIGTRDENDNLTALQLTVDLKPDLLREEERIKQCKGRIFSLQDEPEVPRVWMPNNDCPGLAMARAFGDFCVKDFGVISVPEISYRRITERDEFVVLATDGIWDVLADKEVVDIVASAPSQSCAARSLVEAASQVWHNKYSASKIDDCAVVCLFLNTDPSNGLMS